MNPTRPAILVTGPMPSPVINVCRQKYATRTLSLGERIINLSQMERAAIQGIATAGTPPIDARFMDSLPNLQIVANLGVGYDSVDASEAAKRGVVVTNTPDVLTDDVADIAIGLIISAVRELRQAEAFLRAGKWQKGPFRLAPTRLKDRHLGVLGLGRIGAAVAKRAEGFGMTVAYHNRRPKDSRYRYYPSLEALADDVDTLVVATPGNSSTKDLVNADILNRLGSQGIVVNVARGAVVNESELVRALQENTIAGAGLDVYENEPAVSSRLMSLENVTLLPHIGSASAATRADMWQLLTDNLDKWFNEDKVITPVPESLAIKPSSD